jgi:hypothetical protein
MNGKKENTAPVGRPTKYDPSFASRVDEYITTVLTQPKTLPTVEGFAIFLGVDTDSINNWAKARIKDSNGEKTKERLHPEFFSAVKRLKSIQKDKLVNDGLYGGRDVNVIMAIFLLKNNHGMADTQNLDHTTKGKEMPTPIYGGQSTKSE